MKPSWVTCINLATGNPAAEGTGYLFTTKFQKRGILGVYGGNEQVT